MKPGYKTTEFSVAIVNTFLGIAVMKGQLTPNNVELLSEPIMIIAGALVTGISSLGYSIGRGLAKRLDIVPEVPPEPEKPKRPTKKTTRKKTQTLVDNVEPSVE